MSASEACCFSHRCWFIYLFWPLVPSFHVSSHFCSQSMWHPPSQVIFLPPMLINGYERRSSGTTAALLWCGVSALPCHGCAAFTRHWSLITAQQLLSPRASPPSEPKGNRVTREDRADRNTERERRLKRDKCDRRNERWHSEILSLHICAGFTCESVFACVCMNVCHHTHTERLQLCARYAWLCNICMSGISMYIYAYVRVSCVCTVHLSAYGVCLCVSVCGRDKDMKEEGPPWCLYVIQCQRGNDSSLSPTQGRQGGSVADFSWFSAFFSPSPSEM